MKYAVLILSVVILFSGCMGKEPETTTVVPEAEPEGPDLTVPTVESTSPEAGATDVDPALTVITVTFSEPMKDGYYSWAYTKKEDFPTTTGNPYFDKTMTMNSLPVKLKPGKSYEIWINSQRLKNFQDKAGNPARPYKLTFTTKK